MYIANNLIIIVFLFCIDFIVDSTMHIMVYLLYYVYYKDNIIIFIKYDARNKICIQLQMISLK